MLEVRLDGLTLRVANVLRSMEFYRDKLGLRVEIDKAPQFAMIRVGGPTGGTIGLLAHDAANPSGSASTTPEQRAGIHVELTTDDLDGLYEHLKAAPSSFTECFPFLCHLLPFLVTGAKVVAIRAVGSLRGSGWQAAGRRRLGG
jgi:catechol 2,3-dioxygenase-like lactoylglutathione lyase family enzyme